MILVLRGNRMRLIDADALEKRMLSGNPYFNEAVEQEIAYIIETQPTAETAKKNNVEVEE